MNTQVNFCNGTCQRVRLPELFTYNCLVCDNCEFDRLKAKGWIRSGKTGRTLNRGVVYLAHMKGMPVNLIANKLGTSGVFVQRAINVIRRNNIKHVVMSPNLTKLYKW